MAKRLSALLTLVVLTCSATASHAGQVWLSGIDPVVTADRLRTGGGPSATGDFMALFQPDAPWPRAARDIQVFKVSTQFLQRSTDAQLSTVIKDLRRRHIALGMAAEIMATSAACGNGVPGYTTRAVIQTVADRVARLGGSIDYVAFDSPVAFGHFAAERPTACHYSIPDLVQNIAPNIKVLKAGFPNIVFGDVEPVNNHTVGWLDAYLDFAAQFRQVTGERLAFLDADLIWYDRWRPQLAEWGRRVRQTGMTYGVIFDGSGIDKSDLEWTNHAVERYWLLARDPAIRPDDSIFQTWHAYPSRFLPEGARGTLTSVVLQTVGSPGASRPASP